MEIETPVLLAYVIEDSTDIFRISGGGFEHPKPPLSVRHCSGYNVVPCHHAGSQYKTWENILFLASSLWQICSEWMLCAVHCPLCNVASCTNIPSTLHWVKGVTPIVWLCPRPQTATFPRTRAVMLACNDYSSSLYFSAPELAHLYFASTAKGKARPGQAVRILGGWGTLRW